MDGIVIGFRFEIGSLFEVRVPVRVLWIWRNGWELCILGRMAARSICMFRNPQLHLSLCCKCVRAPVHVPVGVDAVLVVLLLL